MLTTRETASLLLIGAAVVALFVVPRLRKSSAPHVRDILRAAFGRPLPAVYLMVALVSSASTGLAWKIGIWNWGLAKDAVIITATVVLPMTFRSFNFKSGGGLVLHLMRETLGLAALISFYLGTAPLPLVGELIIQPLVALVLLIEVYAGSDPKHASAKRICDILLLINGTALIAWSTVTLFSGAPDWREIVQTFLFSAWLPLSLIPFFYLFGFYALTDKVFARFRAMSRPLTPRLTLAFMIGTRLRLSLLAEFSGRYNSVAQATGFLDGLRRMRDFRADLAMRQKREVNRVGALREKAGQVGVDGDGFHIDRRDFDVTKARLDWIWTCQNGQWDRQGRRYWDHLTDTIVDAGKHGLPADHGFRVEIAEAGRVWRAWRATPGGAVLGVGGRLRRSKYYFQGDAPPVSWPEESDEWVDAMRAPWPPDWNKDDGTRL